MEVVTNPAMIFLDEPTSGLDTYTAYSVIRMLKALANGQGRTVVATVHQPSSEIYHLFDDLLIMAQGKIMFYGTAERAIEYFGEAGYQCPTFTNPSDYFFMRILKDTDEVDGEGEVVEDSQERIEGLLERWLESEDYVKMKADMRQAAAGNEGVSVTALRHRAPFMRQFWFLLNRASKNALRNRMIVAVRFFQSVFIGVIIGLVYLDVNSRSPIAQVQDRAGVLFFFAIYAFFSSSNSVLTIFSLEKRVFYREYRAGYYSLPAYYISKVLVEIPYEIIFPFLMVLIPYYMIGLKPAFSAYLLAALFVALTAMCGTVPLVVVRHPNPST
jgi:ATP-binding cassette subfamily G (WHITE) protein 1